MKSKYKVDYVTQNPLRKGWNLHHCDLDESNYEDITNEGHFACLNKMMHETIHNLYRYFEKDEKVMARLLNLLKKMKELNHGKRCEKN